MSIVRMRKAFRRKMKIGVGKTKIALSPMDIIFWAIVVIFVVGAYYTFGAPNTGGAGPGQQTAAKLSANVARVNGHVISRAEYMARYAPQASDIPQAQFVASDRYLKSSILDGMVQRLLMLDAAKEAGIKATKQDVQQKADEVVQQQVDQRFPTPKAMAKFLRSRQQTLKQYKQELRKKLMEEPKSLEETVVFERLEDHVKNAVKVSDKDLKEKYTKIMARHIMISAQQLEAEDKQKDEAENADGEDKAQTKKDEKPKDYKAIAKKRAEEVIAKLKKGGDFAKLAAEYSQDFGTKDQGGLLRSTPQPGPDGETPEPSDYIARGEVMWGEEFEKAAFALKKGAVSEVVETPYALHVIKVEDRKVEYPEDFKDNKKKYEDDLLEQKKTDTWRQFTENLKKQANTEIQDPELAAYRALEEDNKAQAVQFLNEAVKNDPSNIGAKYQLAQMLKEAGDKANATKYLSDLAVDKRAAGTPMIHMELAELLLEQKKESEAIEEYKSASEWAQTFDYQSMFVHQQAKAKFEELKKPELAAQEQEWLDEFMDFQQQQQAQQFGAPG